jgi:ATP-dependent Clp protease adaptor protein ClpS
MSDHLSSNDPLVTTKPREHEETRTRLLPPYNVIIENDDHHSFEFVVEVLRKVLGCTEQRAFLLTNEAHTTGRAVIWTGAKEVAELKVEQVRTCHETRVSDGAKLGPLSCFLEPAPG